MVFIDIMMKMEILSQRKYNRLLTLLLLILTGILSQAQSCVCYQNHFLNDYKEADFIAQVTVTSVDSDYRVENEDLIEFDTAIVFKGLDSKSLFIRQEVGNSSDNSKCRLFLKPGDELIVFAQLVNGAIITTPCHRNSFIYKDDPKFLLENKNLIGTLNTLSLFNEQIEESSTNCSSLANDTDVIDKVGKLDLAEANAYFGLYNIKFTEDNSISYVGVVSPFNKDVDKKIRIMLIKREWEECALNENRELLVAYFYHPASTYRKEYLSTF